MPEKNSKGEIVFIDHPGFLPNLTPREIFMSGSFGGTYWRPITSTITGKKYENLHKQYPESWWIDIPEDHFSQEWSNYDSNINKYGIKVGTTLEFWEEKNWITEFHPYGWVNWYCDFYSGKRCSDDQRQIKRWQQTAGPNSRFRKWLVSMIVQKKTTYDDYLVSPKIRQTLQHWAYTLTRLDFNLIKVEYE